MRRPCCCCRRPAEWGAPVGVAECPVRNRRALPQRPKNNQKTMERGGVNQLMRAGRLLLHAPCTELAARRYRGGSTLWQQALTSCAPHVLRRCAGSPTTDQRRQIGTTGVEGAQEQDQRTCGSGAVGGATAAAGQTKPSGGACDARSLDPPTDDAGAGQLGQRRS
jgi:hypothetical protein